MFLFFSPFVSGYTEYDAPGAKYRQKYTRFIHSQYTCVLQWSGMRTDEKRADVNASSRLHSFYE